MGDRKRRIRGNGMRRFAFFATILAAFALAPADAQTARKPDAAAPADLSSQAPASLAPARLSGAPALPRLHVPPGPGMAPERPGGRAAPALLVGARLAHDPEKCEAVFGQDHAQRRLRGSISQIATNPGRLRFSMGAAMEENACPSSLPALRRSPLREQPSCRSRRARPSVKPAPRPPQDPIDRVQFATPLSLAASPPLRLPGLLRPAPLLGPALRLLWLSVPLGYGYPYGYYRPGIAVGVGPFGFRAF